MFPQARDDDSVRNEALIEFCDLGLEALLCSLYIGPIIGAVAMENHMEGASRDAIEKTKCPRVAIVGAGIIGMSTAYVLKRDNPNYDVLLMAQNFSPEVTSDGAPGYWYFGGSGAPEEVKRCQNWCLDTKKWFIEIMKKPESMDYGIILCSGYHLSDCELQLPVTKDMLSGLRVLTEDDLKQFPSYIRSGFFITTYACENSIYLPFLLEKFRDLGGKVMRREVRSFDELGDFDVVVNCTGLSAGSLCEDTELFPIRGQVHKVKAPWIHHFYRFVSQEKKQIFYIYPNNNSVVLGGTGQIGDYNLAVSADDKKIIFTETAKLMPSIKRAEHLSDWVGLRPGRSSVRLEKDIIPLPGGRRLKVVHNYGHGRTGVSLHYGCALEAARLVEDCLMENRNKHDTLASKL